MRKIAFFPLFFLIILGLSVFSVEAQTTHPYSRQISVDATSYNAPFVKGINAYWYWNNYYILFYIDNTGYLTERHTNDFVTWSPAVQISAERFQSLHWNVDMNSNGQIFYVATNYTVYANGFYWRYGQFNPSTMVITWTIPETQQATSYPQTGNNNYPCIKYSTSGIYVSLDSRTVGLIFYGEIWRYSSGVWTLLNAWNNGNAKAPTPHIGILNSGVFVIYRWNNVGVNNDFRLNYSNTGAAGSWGNYVSATREVNGNNVVFVTKDNTVYMVGVNSTNSHILAFSWTWGSTSLSNFNTIHAFGLASQIPDITILGNDLVIIFQQEYKYSTDLGLTWSADYLTIATDTNNNIVRSPLGQTLPTLSVAYYTAGGAYPVYSILLSLASFTTSPVNQIILGTPIISPIGFELNNVTTYYYSAKAPNYQLTCINVSAMIQNITSPHYTIVTVRIGLYSTANGNFISATNPLILRKSYTMNLANNTVDQLVSFNPNYVIQPNVYYAIAIASPYSGVYVYQSYGDVLYSTTEGILPASMYIGITPNLPLNLWGLFTFQAIITTVTTTVTASSTVTYATTTTVTDIATPTGGAAMIAALIVMMPLLLILVFIFSHYMGVGGIMLGVALWLVFGQLTGFLPWWTIPFIVICLIAFIFIKATGKGQPEGT